MTINHMVWVKFKPNLTQAEIDKHLSDLQNLKQKIPGIIDFSLGENFTDRAQGFTHGISVILSDKEALQNYAIHTDHVVVAKALINDAEVMALDYEF